MGTGVDCLKEKKTMGTTIKPSKNLKLQPNEEPNFSSSTSFCLFLPLVLSFSHCFLSSSCCSPLLFALLLFSSNCCSLPLHIVSTLHIVPLFLFTLSILFILLLSSSSHYSSYCSSLPLHIVYPLHIVVLFLFTLSIIFVLLFSSSSHCMSSLYCCFFSFHIVVLFITLLFSSLLCAITLVIVLLFVLILSI